MDIYINNNKILNESIINIIDIIILNIGILLILVEGSMRGIIGLIFIGISINIYLMNKGYILISLLLLLSLISISIIIFIIKYNVSNIYKTPNLSRIHLISIFYHGNTKEKYRDVVVRLFCINCRFISRHLPALGIPDHDYPLCVHQLCKSNGYYLSVCK